MSMTHNGKESTSRVLMEDQGWVNSMLRITRIKRKLIGGESLIQRNKIFLIHGTEGCLGRVNTNRDPFPSLLSTDTLPPWASMMCFTMERPSPVPPNSRDRASSTR